MSAAAWSSGAWRRMSRVETAAEFSVPTKISRSRMMRLFASR
jgi:hypothetical protein